MPTITARAVRRQRLHPAAPVAAAALLLGACAPAPPPAASASTPPAASSEGPVPPAPPGPPDATDTCGAAGLQSLVGQPRSVLATMRFGVPVRIEEPGQSYTMDYRADRLRILTDGPAASPQARITQLLCG
jgi:hypothetical protein